MTHTRLPKTIPVLLLLAAIVCFGVGQASAAEKKIRFVSVSWTGVTVKTEIGVRILNSLGYKATNMMTSVPIVYKAMSMGEADVFLGNWMPSMATVAQPFFDDGSVEMYVASMPGAKYTLAVPSFVYDAGLTHFKHIAKYADKLESKIYGIEEGNDGNEIIQSMIDHDLFGLGGFELVPSSEAGMLAQVRSFVNEGQWVVFLGWAPHYMNEIIDMKFLDGSTDETFGPDNGAATVYTNVRKGFLEEMPNTAKFLENFRFPVSMMNQIMATLHKNSDLTPAQAGMAWVRAHPDIYKGWLEGVTTADGKPALPAFEEYLKSEY